MRTAKLTTKRFLFTEENGYVISHLEPSLFIIKTVENRAVGRDIVRNSMTRDGGYWAVCGLWPRRLDDSAPSCRL